MQSEGLSPDRITYICILKAFGNVGFSVKGEKIHDESINKGLFMEEDIMLNNALMNAKEGLEKDPFVAICGGDMVQWSSMLLGYIEHDKNEDAIQLYPRMLVQGLLPTMMTFSSMLKACGNMGELVVHTETKLDFEMDLN